MPSLRSSVRRGSLGGRGFAAFAGPVFAAALHAAPALAAAGWQRRTACKR